MSNEELISQSPFGNKSCSCEKIYTNRNLVAPDCIACNYADEVRELMDAARKHEAMAFGEFLFDYNALDTKIDYLYQHRATKELFYLDELYKLFKTQNN